MVNPICYEIASVILFSRKDVFFRSINTFFAKLLFLINFINYFVGIRQVLTPFILLAWNILSI